MQPSIHVVKNNIKTGQKGEHLAVQYLRIKGYEILERNWRYMHKEIDIIARENDCLVIVEVKTLNGRAFGNPMAGITRKKQSFLVRAAEAYVLNHNLDTNIRFDVIGIILEKNRSELEHIQSAFHPVAE